MKKNQPNTHIFALYCKNLSESLHSSTPLGKKFVLTDEDLVARIGKILRLEIGQSCIVFDRAMHAEVVLESVTKKEVTCVVQKKQNNAIIEPPIHFLLPVLKKDALAEAIYSLAEVGVQEIHLLITQKTQRDWYEKDLHRLQRVIIAAAEQSKQFAFPLLHEPVTLQELVGKIAQTDSQKLFFDPSGLVTSNYLPTVVSTQPLYLLIGPEGDFTAPEKEFIREANFTFCALTPTILRASQAAAISAGLLRSWLNK